MFKRELIFKLSLLRNYVRSKIHYLTGDLLHLLPRLISFTYTYKCNLHCAMCSTIDTHGERFKDAPLDTIKKAFIEIKKSYRNLWYSPRINVTGGEPFIKEEINELLIFLDKMDYKVEVNTNGTLINDKNIDTLLGLSNISLRVSLDGSAQTHDNIRGYYASFNKTVENIKNLFIGGFSYKKVTLAYTISSLNYDNILQFVRDIIQLRWKTNIEFQLLNFTTDEALEQLRIEGRQYFGIDDLGYNYTKTKLNLVDVPALIEQIKKIKLIASENGIFVLFKPDVPIKDLEKYYYGYDSYALNHKCYEPKRFIRIQPDGTVFPCFMELALGNITTQGLKEIYYSERARKFRNILSKHLFSACRRCCMLKRAVFY